MVVTSYSNSKYFERKYRLSAAWMRQLIYGSTRFGLYLNLFDYVRNKKGGENLNIFEKAGISLTAGAIGSFVGSPCELILLRMQADELLPKDSRRNYKGFFDATRSIYAQEGFTSLWKGATPGICRSMAAALGLFTSYETAKDKMKVALPNNEFLGFVIASFIAGGFCAGLSLPFDNAKTKL
jgi:solute carrier family 25 (mitochondrial oxoglutarate transporter), member 11